MKHKLLRILPFLLLGGVLGLAASPAAFETAGVKAEDVVETKEVKFTSSKIKSSITNTYSNATFTIDNLSFGSKNICYQGSSGSEYLQIKGGTSNGFWSTSTFDDYYISHVSMKVASNACNLGLGSTSSISTFTNVAVGEYSADYTQVQGNKYIKIMSTGSVTQIKSLTITFSKNSDQPLPPFEGDYTLVESVSDLNSGDKIVLGNVANQAVAGVFGSYQYFSATAGTFGDGELTPTTPDVITLLATDGGWNLFTQAEGYIGCSESGKLAKGAKDTWTISIAEGGAATIDNGTYKIKYNKSSPRFSCYTGEPTDSMPLPEIYKAKNSEIDTFTVTYNGNGATGSTIDSKEYNIGSEATVLANSFDKPVGKTFKEWNTKADGTGTSYLPDAKITMVKNVELFAIWDEEYIPVGDSYTRVTSAADLTSVSEFLFVYQSGSTVKANGSLEGGDYLKAYDAKIIDDELTYNNEKVVPLSLEKDGGDWLIKLNSNYLAITADSTNKLAWKAKSSASKWSISFNGNNVVVSTLFNEKTYSIQYNPSGAGRFSNYSSTMSQIEMWAKTGHAKEVHLSTNELDLNVTFKGIIAVTECIGFEPTSYLWEITAGSEFVSITNGQGTDEVELTALAEGQAEVTVTVDGVKAKAVINVHDYKYNILDKENYFITASGVMLGGDLSYIIDVDFTDSSNMWHFEKAYDGDNSYFLLSGDKYLSFSEDVYQDGKNVSEIELTDTPYNVWTVTYNETNGYKVSTVTNSQGTRSLAHNDEKWYAYTGNNYVDLLQGGTFDYYKVEALPTTKQYFVGDALKPSNSHVYAYYTNGYRSEITNKITWDTLTAGTKAYGKCTILGEEVDIVMDGLFIYKGDASTFVVSGLADTFSPGERINKDNLTVGITYKLSGEEDIVKDKLNKDEFVIEPEKIAEDTESIKISLTKDPTVFYEKDIEVEQNPYVVATHVFEGDQIAIGTLGYNPYEITGGVELTHDGEKFGYDTFNLMPHGGFTLEVGKEGSYYTLKDPVTGYYLKGDNSALGFNEPDFKSVYPEGDGHYEFNLNVNIAGGDKLVTVKTSTTPDFNNPAVFTGTTYKGGMSDYMNYASDLDNNKIVFTYWSSSNDWVEPIDTAEVVFSEWKFENNVFIYALEISSTLPEECLFTLNYDEDYEEWIISSKPHQDKQLYFNKDGKFGFYTKGSSYTPVMVFRDNDKPLASNPTSVSVSFTPIDGSETGEVMNTVTVGEQFPWTSALIVKVNYSGGASKIIPVGGYTLKQAPDTSVIGPSTGIISYGQNGHQIDKEFIIFVKGKTQAFDVVCKDPILVGETYQAHLDHYEPPEGEPVTWSVSDPTLATIDQDGNVTGLNPGYVNVIATSYDGTYSDYEHIQIYKQVTSVTLDKHEVEINAGESSQLTATVKPDDASNKNVTYSSEDPTIAFVDEKTGLITGVSEGTVTITCAAQNHPEENFDTCEVTVKPAQIVHVTGIELDCQQKDLKVKAEFTLHAIVKPDNATVKNVIWSVDHENIATVNQSGKVKGVKKGQCKVTATTVDGEFAASCIINVKDDVTPIPVTSVTLNTTSKQIEVDGSFELIATVKPDNADTKQVSFETLDGDIVSINQTSANKATITGLEEGTAVIEASCGGKTARCTVTVHNTVKVESVSIDKTDVQLAINETEQLNAIINPSNADNQAVSWKSSDTKVVTVDSDGKIKAVGVGEAIITVKTNDGGKTATCKVTVTQKGANYTGVAIGVGCGVGAVGIGCGVGIPLGIKAHKKRKIAK